MIKFSTPSKKEILNLLKKFNDFLANNLGALNLKNFRQWFKSLIYDRRFHITIAIIILSVFAHLSAPAFYQDKWVLSKIKKQLETEFDFNFVLPEKVNYSMFPVPSFHLKNVELIHDNKRVSKIKLMKLYLSYNKFFDKEKVNIQNIYVEDSQIEIYNNDIKEFFNFFDKEINNKILFLKNNKFFFKSKSDEIYAILTAKESSSYFDQINFKNTLNFKGEVFNNPLKVNLLNDYLKKKIDLNVELKKIGKKLNLKLDYLIKPNIAIFELQDGSNSYVSNIKLGKNNLVFDSNQKINDKSFYKGFVNFKPFYSNIEINLRSFDLSNLIDLNGIFLQILNSEIISNPNLNYKIELNSEKIKNHRLLSNLVLCLSYDQKNFNFDKSKIIFDDNVEMKIIESKYTSDENGNFFSGKINFLIKNDKNLYKFFQSKKQFRKPLKKISLSFEFNFNSSNITINKIELNDKSNEKIEDIIKNYKNKELKNLRRLEIKNLFNEVIATL